LLYSLIQQALRAAGVTKALYIQILDSDQAGVVAACNGYLETFDEHNCVVSIERLGPAHPATAACIATGRVGCVHGHRQSRLRA
jgi:hypothetical protein